MTLPFIERLLAVHHCSILSLDSRTHTNIVLGMLRDNMTRLRYLCLKHRRFV